MRSLVLVLCVAASAAWADIPPPDVGGCNGKTAGDACKRDDGTDATCVKATCSKNDYSEGPPPKSVTYECLQCAGPKAAPPEKKGSCAAAPGEVLGVLGLVLALRRRSRR